MNQFLEDFIRHHKLEDIPNASGDSDPPKTKIPTFLSSGWVEWGTEEIGGVLQCWEYPDRVEYYAAFRSQHETFEHEWTDSVPASTDYFAQLIKRHCGAQPALF